MKNLQTKKIELVKGFKDSAMPTGSIGQERNLQKKTSSKTREKLTIQQIMSTAERRWDPRSPITTGDEAA